MKLRADQPVAVLTVGLQQTLTQLRALRGFDAQQVLDAKVAVIAEYLQNHHLSGTVLGVSGGVDSAVAACLLDRVARLPNSPLQRLELVCLPSLNDDSVSRQDRAVELAHTLESALGRQVRTIPLGPALRPLRESVETAMDIAHDTWGAGQAVSYLRTPFFYQLATLLTQKGCRAIVAGTINRDEGAYLGYVGKAGDGMVDLHLLSDLHKSEVYQLADLLGVPEPIQQATPSADMFDGCADTDIFGAPYDAVELVLLARSIVSPAHLEQLTAQWSSEDRDCWERVVANLEQLHACNAHKYMVGSPAVHLDVLDSAVPGGWAPSNPAPYHPPSTVVSKRPAVRALKEGDRREWVSLPKLARRPSDQGVVAISVPQLLTPLGVSALMEQLEGGTWQQSDLHGKWQHGTVSSQPQGANSGSWRTSFEDAALAQALWEHFQHCLPSFRTRSTYSRFGATSGAVWRAVGVSGVFRVLRYFPGEQLVAHYDAPFVFGPRRQTGMTALFYLEGSSAEGGSTRLLHDGQDGLEQAQCQFDDWERTGTEEEVYQRFASIPGDGCVFDHQLLHDSEPLLGGRKTVVRTDIIFERVGP